MNSLLFLAYCHTDDEASVNVENDIVSSFNSLKLINIVFSIRSLR